MAVDTRDMQRALRAWAAGTFVRAVEEMGAELDRFVPVATGALRQSQQIGIHGALGTIRYPGEYASYTDEGTPPHPIVGNPLLAFVWHGQLVIVHSVNHPGTKGTRWWSTTMTDRTFGTFLNAAGEAVAFR